jgi:hypothetical protein
VNVNVRNMDVGRVGVCILCGFDIEDRECGVGTDVNSTMMSATLQIVGVAEAAGRVFRLRKKTMLKLVCMR